LRGDAPAGRIAACRACPRLVTHCREVAREKKRAYRDERYWGKPVPSFGPISARLLVVGLAPGAHGANRTGRVFTGDSSGDWLFRALFDAGFANRTESIARRDGLKMQGARVSCAVRCAPPGNRPEADERNRCRAFLAEELAAMRRLRVVVALGGIAFDAVRRAWRESGRGAWEARPAFGHASETRADDGTLLLGCYHPSRQNTNTGRLTREMLAAVMGRARGAVG
jgi:uracil-DNA glycosylase family 4